jgi:fructose-1,6-bisphosphatase/inositol monophosphatase family enzyme
MKERLSHQSRKKKSSSSSGQWGMPDMEKVVGKVANLAARAGTIIESLKPDGKRADRVADRFWLNVLRKEFPGDCIITEETFRPGDLELTGRRVWFVDPLDGTSTFQRGEEGYATMAALVENNEVRLGVVHQPATGRTYYALKGAGAFLGRKKLHVSSFSTIEKMRLIHRHTMSNNLGDILDSLPCREKSVSGSLGVKLCLIASGRYDITVYDTQPNLWDILPGKIILEEAGGKITDLFGREISLKAIKTSGILATNDLAHREILEKIQPLSRIFNKKKL